jgi:hypothetical protein
MLSPPDGGIMSPKMRFAIEALRDINRAATKSSRLAPGAVPPTAHCLLPTPPPPTPRWPSSLEPGENGPKGDTHLMAIYGEMAIYGRRACYSDAHLRWNEAKTAPRVSHA